jgi:hypothetical protein
VAVGTKQDGKGSSATVTASEIEIGIETEAVAVEQVRGSDSGSEGGPALAESCVAAVVDPS